MLRFKSEGKSTQLVKNNQEIKSRENRPTKLEKWIRKRSLKSNHLIMDTIQKSKRQNNWQKLEDRHFFKKWIWLIDRLNQNVFRFVSLSSYLSLDLVRVGLLDQSFEFIEFDDKIRDWFKYFSKNN